MVNQLWIAYKCLIGGLYYDVPPNLAVCFSQAFLLPLFSSAFRVFISNLQKEIEKQTGQRSSRRRRSASQYDYEVYHSLAEVGGSNPLPTHRLSYTPSPAAISGAGKMKTQQNSKQLTPLHSVSLCSCFMLVCVCLCVWERAATPPQTPHSFGEFIFPPLPGSLSVSS